MSAAAPPLFHLHQGESALVISVPHAGVFMPPEVAPQLTEAGRAMVDTDWHVDRLYDFAPGLGATLLVATHSRNVVDLNRSPSGGKLYPGQAETAICPGETFAGEPLYAEPLAPAEMARRIGEYWQPYHAALQAELDRVRARHGRVHLLDAHSIRGEIPRLFAGALPDLNFGTNSGASAAPGLVARAIGATKSAGFGQVLDGRFRGGHITRQYGRPDMGVHAIQLELAQRCYMDEAASAPTAPMFDAVRAAPLMAVLRSLVVKLLRV